MVILPGISKNPTFKEKCFNLLLGIGIPELLLNLVSCHGFIMKLNSNVVLNFDHVGLKIIYQKDYTLLNRDQSS